METSVFSIAIRIYHTHWSAVAFHLNNNSSHIPYGIHIGNFLNRSIPLRILHILLNRDDFISFIFSSTEDAHVQNR